MLSAKLSTFDWYPVSPAFLVPVTQSIQRWHKVDILVAPVSYVWSHKARVKYKIMLTTQLEKQKQWIANQDKKTHLLVVVSNFFQSNRVISTIRLV